MISYEDICQLNAEFKSIDDETVFNFHEDEIRDHIVRLDGQIQIIEQIKGSIMKEFNDYIKKVKNLKKEIQGENIRRKREEDNVEFLELIRQTQAS